MKHKIMPQRQRSTGTLKEKLKEKHMSEAFKQIKEETQTAVESGDMNPPAKVRKRCVLNLNDKQLKYPRMKTRTKNREGNAKTVRTQVLSFVL